MIPDRTKQPPFIQINHLPEIHDKVITLENGVKLHAIQSDVCEMFKFDMVFYAGTSHADSPLVAKCAHVLSTEGTKKMNADEIAERFDYYGAFLEKHTGSDFSVISLFSHGKYFPKVLPLLQSVLYEAIFPQHEYKLFLQNDKSKYMVDSELVSVLTKRKFINEIFKDHPLYGKVTRLSDYDSISRDQVLRFYEKHYLQTKWELFITGNISEDELRLIGQIFGSRIFPSYSVRNKKEIKQMNIVSDQHLIKKKGSVQTAVRIGRRLFDRSHPDYAPMYFVNTLFGGYFGSRLMQKIREEKGLTYGITSGIIPMLYDGYFFVSADVKSRTGKQVVEHVFCEMERLQKEEVTAAEMQLVRNYLMGRLLRNFDGPYAKANRLRTIALYGLNKSFYRDLAHTISCITADVVKELAWKYLRPDAMSVVMAGDI